MSVEEVIGELERMKSARSSGKHFALSEFGTFSVTTEGNTYRSGRMSDVAQSIHIRIIRTLEVAGWWVGQDKKALYYKNDFMHENNAGGAIADLRLSLKSCARIVSVKFWVDHETTHPNGPRYESHWDFEAKLTNLQRLRFRKTIMAIRECMLDMGYADATEPSFENPYDKIEFRVRDSWHFKGEKNIWVPRKTSEYNAMDRDKQLLVNGQRRWFYGGYASGYGNLFSGTVFSNINNMWWVVSGGEVRNIGSSDLFTWNPGMPRRMSTGNQARRRVVTLLASEVAAENFERAAILRNRRDELGSEENR